MTLADRQKASVQGGGDGSSARAKATNKKAKKARRVVKVPRDHEFHIYTRDNCILLVKRVENLILAVLGHCTYMSDCRYT